MAIVVDASFAAAWFLPDESNELADDVARRLAARPGLAPSIFSHELRNLLLVAHRRGRLSEAAMRRQLDRAARFPLRDAGPGETTRVLQLAIKHNLSAYDAAYLSLAIDEKAQLATCDRNLAAAARNEGVPLLS